MDANDECQYNDSENCELKDRFNNECIRCKEGYLLNNDNQCEKDLDNCVTHDFDGNDKLICTECAVNFIITADDKCKKGTIPNCYNYK